MGRPGYATITLDPSAPFTGILYTERPDATASPYTRLYTPLPEATDCSTNYWVDEAYCVGIADDDDGTMTASSTTTTASPTQPTPPGPTMSGSPDNCNKWSLVTASLSCTDLASQAGISLAQFLAWNPAVSSDCVTNYWLGEACCVGLSA
ncbi:uncharacterized protein N7518_004532 [Penicillium psychrosexuale]|uniref:uncharacterized protein n=1 Tax=Penicillium psychrosexuale TaxID=1002107 RepID=UPI002545B142|nr:uncharacterized protein N7518_004532 [Penicillium psychrosexuale]KAJ5795992.1 hypothetical protein N7518_004532 [Penicillium psychrosexuale]